MPVTFPTRVTLVTSSPFERGGIWLADATTNLLGVGDVVLDQAMVLSLGASAPDSLCEIGSVAELRDVPASADACPASNSGTWQARVYLSAAAPHTYEESRSVGVGLLVRDAARTALYRLRILGDSYDADGVSRVTFDYEPVP